MNKAVFLDRDGTIIYDRHYLKDPELVELMPGITDGLRCFKEHGFLLVLVSNQSGIARGYFGEKELALVQERIDEILQAQGLVLDGIYHCPHGSDDACDCRKPKIGMALKAQRDLGLDLASCYMVGDKESDMQFGMNFGAKRSFYSVKEAAEYIAGDCTQ